MKKFILLIIVFAVLVVSGYCQIDTSSAKINNNLKNQYLTKAKRQKTAAWICLGGGIGLITTGIISSSHKVINDYTIFASNFFYPTPYIKSSNYTDDVILIYAGLVATGASIPLFIASGKNKHKANLMVTVQKTAEGLPFTAAKNLTGLTLSISL